MTHAELVERAGRWLAKTKRCPVVATDLVTGCPETPDAIGWRMGLSHLVECKASRSDFLADRKKHFRQHPASGVGAFRYYMTPPGLVSPDEIPDGWGLLEVHPASVRVIRDSHKPGLRGVVAFLERNTTGEAAMLVSIIRRERGEYTNTERTRTTIHVEPEHVEFQEAS